MATLKVLPEIPPPPPKEYVLTLSEAEARAVRTLCGTVLGPSEGAFRAATNAVWEVLDKAIHGEELADVDAPDIPVNESMNRYVRGEE